MPEQKYKITCDKYPDFVSCNKCQKRWFELKAPNLIKIMGPNFSTECEINFNFIRVTCKCGHSILLMSDIPADISAAEQYATNGESEWAALVLDSRKVMPQDKWFFDLSSPHRNALLKTLSESQRQLYQIILNTNGNTEKIKAQYGLAENIIEKNITKIIKEIEIITGEKCPYTNTGT